MKTKKSFSHLDNLKLRIALREIVTKKDSHKDILDALYSELGYQGGISIYIRRFKNSCGETKISTIISIRDKNKKLISVAKN